MSQKNSSKNIIIVLLLLAIVGLGVFAYQAATDKPDLSIDLSEEGLDINTN